MPNTAPVARLGQAGTQHYENFPVASWWCPPRYRAPIAAIYHYARTADDLADEGDAPTAQRLADLAEYRADLLQAVGGGAARPSCRWPQVMAPLARQVAEHRLPLAPRRLRPQQRPGHRRREPAAGGHRQRQRLPGGQRRAADGAG